MMKHVVFIVGSYHPQFSAVGFCAHQVIKCLQNEFRISVISIRNSSADSEVEMHGKTKILRVETSDQKRRNNLAGTPGLRARGLLLIFRIWMTLKKLVGAKTIDYKLVGAFANKLNNLDVAPDAIIPLVFPFETVLAALSHKEANPEVTVLPYLFDDFVESRSLHSFAVARQMKKRGHLNLERTMLMEADAILAMHPLQERFKRYFETSLLRKIFFLEHPLLTRPARPVRHDDQAIRVCFTGSLIKGVVEPDYLLEMLEKVQTTRPTRFDFFVMGNNSYKVKNRTLNEGNQIVNHGRVAKPLADAALSSADIFINLGEFRGKQVSSKIFEYMSTGKPLIHLANVREDINTKILSKYPLALCLLQDRRDLEKNALQISEFLDKHRGVRLPFVEVKSLYPEALPSTTAALINKLVMNEINTHAQVGQ